MSEQSGLFANLAEKWPSTYVARGEVGKFSGGILHPRSMANLDCLGKGPEGRIHIGKKKVAYPVQSLIRWMEKRAVQAVGG